MSNGQAFSMRQKELQEKQKSKPTCSPNAIPAARLQNNAGQHVQWNGVVVHAVARILRCEYCFRRGTYYAIENTTSSLLWCYDPLEVHQGWATATHIAKKNRLWILKMLGDWILLLLYVSSYLAILFPATVAAINLPKKPWRRCWSGMVPKQYQSLWGNTEPRVSYSAVIPQVLKCIFTWIKFWQIICTCVVVPVTKGMWKNMLPQISRPFATGKKGIKTLKQGITT